MKLTGMNFTDSSDVAYSGDFRSQPVYFSGYSESARCEIPKTPEDSADVARLRRSLVPKDRFNEHIGARVLSNIVGYYLFIIPGVVLYATYSNQREDAIAKSRAIREEPLDAPLMPSGVP